MQLVAEGVRQIKVPMKNNPLGYTYSYLLEKDLTLIDTGAGNQEAINALTRDLRSIGLDLDDIQRIFVTHLHGDHIGLVDYIRDISGAKVIAHESAVENQRLKKEHWRNVSRDIESEAKLIGATEFQGFINNIARTLQRHPYVLEIDKSVRDGESIELDDSKLVVYWTPGHASEHICLYDSERKLFYAGDHVLPKITPHVSVHNPWEGDPLSNFIYSLNKIRGLKVVKVLPAHEWMYENLDARIDALIEHHYNRCNEMKLVMQEGASTVYEISSRVHWDSRPWPQMSFRTKRMAAAETLAHLVYMRNNDEISEKLQNGTLFYSLV